MYAQLFTHINQFVKLEETHYSEVSAYFEYEEFRKKEILTPAGKKCDRIYFVVKGCLRSYFVDKQGIEKTLQFAIENWWISDFLAFHHQGVTNFSIRAVNAAQVISITYQNQQKLLRKFPVMERYFRTIYEIGYGAAINRIHYIFSYSKEDIFFFFSEEFPEFVNRIPQYMLATYLGLTPEYLSQLRKRKRS